MIALVSSRASASRVSVRITAISVTTAPATLALAMATQMTSALERARWTLAVVSAGRLIGRLAWPVAEFQEAPPPAAVEIQRLPGSTSQAPAGGLVYRAGPGLRTAGTRSELSTPGAARGHLERVAGS